MNEAPSAVPLAICLFLDQSNAVLFHHYFQRRDEKRNIEIETVQ